MEAERMLLLNAACSMLGIEKPTIWDLDRIHECINSILKLFHDSPDMRKWFKGLRTVNSNLRLTLFISMFKCIVLERKDVKRLLDLYNNAVNVLSKDNVTISDVVDTHIIMVKFFEKFV